MNPCQPQYPSGAASLFAVMTRTVIITCPHCLSENTELVDHEHDIHRCLDRTRFGLCRMCVASYEKYPDLETWLKLLPETAAPLIHRYTERITSQVFIGYLWIYYKGR